MSSTIKSIYVTYDGPDRAFCSGDFISGRVVLEVGKDCKIDSLTIKAKGKSEVLWTEHHNKTTVTYHSKDKFFSILQYIIQEQKGKGKDHETLLTGQSGSTQCNVVAPGQHIYPFTFQIPLQAMPSSFKGDWGKIRYTLEAKLSRSMRMNSKAMAEFPFVSRVDLYSNPDLMTPQHGAKDKKMRFFTSGTVGMNVHIERQGFHLGEDLRVVAAIENSSSREIKPKYTLYQKQSFFARGKRRVSTKDILKDLVTSTVNTSLRSTLMYHTLQTQKSSCPWSSSRLFKCCLDSSPHPILTLVWTRPGTQIYPDGTMHQEPLDRERTNLWPLERTNLWPLERTNQWPLERTNQWPLERTNQRLQERTNQRLQERTNQRPLERTNLRPLERTNLRPLERTNLRPLERTNLRPLERTNQRPLERTNQRPLERTNQRPLERTNQRPLERTNQRPLERTNQRPLERTNQRPLERTNQRPLERTNQRPLERTNQRPLERTNQRPLERTNQRPLERTNLRPLERTNQRPLEHANQRPRFPVHLHQSMDLMLEAWAILSAHRSLPYGVCVANGDISLAHQWVGSTKSYSQFA
ncbi:hypothetical protein DPEC_G00125080 [Dallia pectoralis]|uniref:Uncharacterized protein n=1 Tax=Dallia pectoralis TaxID=75939 RepID=A0ACC2GQV6_DALPE|nr:hypothetical protein DPEC_G00125080 [Dallia pectoralis]